MKTAFLKYRTYIPWGWIAIPYVYLEIHGDKDLQRSWNEIEYDEKERVDNHNDDVEDKFRKTVEPLEAQLKQTPFFSFSVKRKLRESIYEADEERCNSLEKYSYYRQIGRAKNFLLENGFIKTRESKHGDECVDTTEEWRKD